MPETPTPHQEEAPEVTHTATTEASHTTATEEPTGALGTLGINGTQFIAQLVGFAIILLIMWRWVYKPLLKVMDGRTKKINDGLAHSKEADKRLSEASAEKERLLREAQVAAHQTMEQAQARAEEVRKEKMAQAKAEIEKVIIEAKEQIKQERTAAFDALKEDVAQLIALATGKVAAKLDEKEQRGMIQQALKEIERA